MTRVCARAGLNTPTTFSRPNKNQLTTANAKHLCFGYLLNITPDPGHSTLKIYSFSQIHKHVQVVASMVLSRVAHRIINPTIIHRLCATSPLHTLLKFLIFGPKKPKSKLNPHKADQLHALLQAYQEPDTIKVPNSYA